MRTPGIGASAFHGLVLAGAFTLLAQAIALPTGVVLGALGAVLASVAASVLARARVRLVPTLAGAGLMGGLLLGASRVLVETELGARTLGLRGALEWADALGLAGLVFAGVLALRALALRIRAALVLEGILVVAAVAAPVAAHRDGMIARPLELADAFWRQGLDPVLAFLGLGLLGALLVAGAFVKGRGPGRTLAQLAVVGLVGLALAVPLHRRSGEASLRDPLGAGGRGGASEGPSEDGEGRPATAEDELEGRQREGPVRHQRPVAVVVFHKDVAPLFGVFYFRHAAFSQFNGNRLVESTRPDADRDVPWRFPTATLSLPGPPEGAPGREVVAADAALVTEHRRMFVLGSPLEVAPMANPAPARFKRSYRMVSSVVSGPIEHLLGRKAGDASWSAELWDHYTAIPQDPRYLELAARIDQTLKDAYRDDPMARALAVKKHLEETTIYTFAEQYRGDDPAAQFLFVEGDRRGYCTHLSHAAVLLLRAMGIPARVGAGYGVMADNLRGGSALLIKSGDAHAWTEIHLEGIGWVPIEIVPERTEFEPPPFEEEDLQRLLGEMARGEGRESVVPPDDGALLGALVAVLRALPWLLVALVGLAYAIRLVRLVRPTFSPEAVASAYRAGLDRLAAHGLVRERGESRERFAMRVAAVAPSFVPLTTLLIATVLGGRRIGRAPGGLSAAGLAKAVGRELSERRPAWRRLVAAVHPAPWLWSR